jgi:trk system potassium uptake protein TrkH
MTVMSQTESASFGRLLFEVVSGLSNTGLSMGITSDLSAFGRLVLVVTMFIGRVGPLALVFFFVGRRKPLLYNYAEEEVLVG